jgi:hypothetical protein
MLGLQHLGDRPDNRDSMQKKHLISRRIYENKEFAACFTLDPSLGVLGFAEDSAASG